VYVTIRRLSDQSDIFRCKHLCVFQARAVFWLHSLRMRRGLFDLNCWRLRRLAAVRHACP